LLSSTVNSSKSLIFQLFNKTNHLTVSGFSRFLFFVIILLEIEKTLSIAAEVAGIAKYFRAKSDKIGNRKELFFQ
jgi:hypothetical protein